MLPEFIDSLRQMEIILKDGSYYEIEKEDLIAWSRTYKDCNVIYEIRAAAEWCEANPSRRKTLRGIRRFINAWLSKANKLKGSPLTYNSEAKRSNIEESLNDISWIDEGERKKISKWYISSKGFYYLNGKKYTEVYGNEKVVNLADKKAKKQSKKS
ncbi:MAG: hypothetical protein VX097_00405 [Pseudomonadota bacterium]|nr:hypothetical protein [Pseudomonadota bacterium]